METRSGNPSAKVQAQLVKHDAAVMVYIGDAPIEITAAKKPKTYAKLVSYIEQANASTVDDG